MFTGLERTLETSKTQNEVVVHKFLEQTLTDILNEGISRVTILHALHLASWQGIHNLWRTLQRLTYSELHSRIYSRNSRQ